MFRYLFCTIALSLAATAVSTPVLAAPFRTPDLDAATTWEIKPSYQWASNGFEHETGYEMDITAPIRPGLETSITFGSGTFKTRGEKEKTADANRLLHGTPKNLRDLAKARGDKAARDLDAHKKD